MAVSLVLFEDGLPMGLGVEVPLECIVRCGIVLLSVADADTGLLKVLYADSEM